MLQDLISERILEMPTGEIPLAVLDGAFYDKE